MELGAFSISLAVKDIEASRRFYEKFGFKVFAGDAAQNWLILKNGAHVIGRPRPAARFFHRCPRAAAQAEGTRIAAATRGGREHNRTGQLRRCGP
jgi:catechol 2,3-dioxygenase-like lactoylglutathione lyase family enzyme